MLSTAVKTTVPLGPKREKNQFLQPHPPTLQYGLEIKLWMSVVRFDTTLFPLLGQGGVPGRPNPTWYTLPCPRILCSAPHIPGQESFLQRCKMRLGAITAEIGDQKNLLFQHLLRLHCPQCNSPDFFQKRVIRMFLLTEHSKL